MEISTLLDKPIWQLSGREFVALMKSTLQDTEKGREEEPKKRFVFGLDGICDLFGCSKSTAERIKQSGIIDAAITQVKRKIVVDAELALQLFGNRMKAGAVDVDGDSSDLKQSFPSVLEISSSRVSTNQGRTGR
ncbi:MAG: DUF3853 family protein [Prevotella sp.]|nr:DUF3853 family protein [Prevotella sp.]